MSEKERDPLLKFYCSRAGYHNREISLRVEEEDEARSRGEAKRRCSFIQRGIDNLTEVGVMWNVATLLFS